MRSVLLVPALVFVAAANAQTTINDAQCRTTISDVLNALKIVDGTNINAYSFVLRMDTTDTIGTYVQNFSGHVSLFHDTTSTAEQVKAEMTLYNGPNPINRTVADGKRVWSYEPSANAYTVNTYNVESGANSPSYLLDFRNFFNQGVVGTPQNFLILMDQIGIGTASRARDWIGGIPFQGQETVDGSVPTHLYRQIWQSVPGNARYVQFNTESLDGGLTWTLVDIKIYRTTPVSSGTRVIDTTITVETDSMGVPLTMNTLSPNFFFTPPSRSKVLATARTVKF